MRIWAAVMVVVTPVLMWSLSTHLHPLLLGSLGVLILTLAVLAWCAESNRQHLIRRVAAVVAIVSMAVGIAGLATGHEGRYLTSFLLLAVGAATFSRKEPTGEPREVPVD
ncbi:hypothetical protein GCM10022377_21970 [Zhihengliuella alba]|uniref:Uncharacterized protein n=1 Tax=Zhihengliuella alba TaxID=547018 RepID=A0ABP7DNM6_9MICC